MPNARCPECGDIFPCPEELAEYLDICSLDSMRIFPLVLCSACGYRHGLKESLPPPQLERVKEYKDWKEGSHREQQKKRQIAWAQNKRFLKAGRLMREEGLTLQEALNKTSRPATD